ncbi:MAG: tRNA (adenosine(37)-N6)-threonylcarbamoyltransferase complex transferase subunit TsaD [Candidatus Pacebacteria bacterium]|nr:tRNA (adenosine(37)-N6)-threonylcarbamoyltransferase complex transferase subunit TsaD [Candidatus Paceibacterota bacterium]
MKILGIETSCDETGICIIETEDNSDSSTISNSKIKILGNQLYSQIAIHAQYGGVFPMMAKREHALNLVPQLEKCLEESGLLKTNLDSRLHGNDKLEKIREILARENDLSENLIELIEKIERPNIDAIAVTNGPGLEPALWVGVCFAKAVSEAWDIPIIPVNHMEGHVVVAMLQPSEKLKVESEKLEYKIKDVNYPIIALLISGGHTQLVLSKENQKYEIIGSTRDDAIGEAFDKVARILGLPYPGGPQISKLAEKDRIENPHDSASGLRKSAFPLPRPMIHSGDLNFSFSGIKTAVLYTVQKIENMTDDIRQEIAREFEDAVVEVIIKKTQQAVEQYGAQTIIIGGGVSANKKIRNDFAKLAEDIHVELMIPEFNASTDNAFMIALAGYINIKAGKKPETDFKANGNLSL